jgi:hypothetical protein
LGEAPTAIGLGDRGHLWRASGDGVAMDRWHGAPVRDIVATAEHPMSRGSSRADARSFDPMRLIESRSAGPAARECARPTTGVEGTA